jgi:hypothetical protein
MAWPSYGLSAADHRKAAPNTGEGCVLGGRSSVRAMQAVVRTGLLFTAQHALRADYFIQALRAPAGVRSDLSNLALILLERSTLFSSGASHFL